MSGYRRRQGSGLPKLSECRGCHDPIRFVRLDTSGKALPVNPAPDPAGNVAACMTGGALHGFVISKDRRPGVGHALRFTAHHATCSAIDRRPAKPKPEPDPALF